MSCIDTSLFDHIFGIFSWTNNMTDGTYGTLEPILYWLNNRFWKWERKNERKILREFERERMKEKYLDSLRDEG